MFKEHPDDEEFDEITSRNLSKITQATENSGYKDGIYDGRQSVFQSSFDMGYKQGFKTGFTLGKYQGYLTTLQQQSANKLPEDIQAITDQYPNDLILKKPTRGQCQICLDQKILDRSIDELCSIHQNHGEKITETLNTRYKDLLDFTGIKKT